MTNENCLLEVCCPKCGQEDRFNITAVITCLVTDDGSEPVGDHDWDDNSSTQCPECGFCGTMKEFRKPSKLPPDPEGKNDDSAAWAASALAAFSRITGADDDTALADLMHWCDRNHFDFAAALERAHGHYEAETCGEVV